VAASFRARFEKEEGVVFIGKAQEYFKEGRALRVETTINDTRAFRIGKRLKNLPALRKDRLCSQPTSASTAALHFES
jgi:hypothetical protein